MRVINLLPWREPLYQKRRRNFLSILLTLLGTLVLMALISYKQHTNLRAAYDQNKTHLRTTVTLLEQQTVLLHQQVRDLAASGEKLQAIKQRRRQQLEWQHHMQQWLMLAADTHISEIKWQGDELLVTGTAVTGAAGGQPGALRRFLQSPAQWQLQQIELDARNRYQFVVSHAAVAPVDF